MSRTFKCRIYAEPKESYRQDQRDFLNEIFVTAYFAGNKVVKFESDSLAPYLPLVLSDLLNQYVGKHIGKNIETLVAAVPAAAIAAHKKPATLQVGAYYKRRDGRVVGPVQANRSAQWPYIVKPLGEAPRTYTAEGRTDPYKCDSKYDLIEFYGFKSEIAAAEPKPLKLEAGKWYKRRDGKVVGPVVASAQQFPDLYPFRTTSLPGDPELFISYGADGRYFARTTKEHPYDLIEEVPAPVPWTQLKVENAIESTDEQCDKILDAARHALANPLAHFARTDSPADPHQEISALSVQEGGNHYKKLRIQPVEYIHANGIPFAEGSVIKYVTRWRDKNGIADLKKARHFLDLLIELEEKAQKAKAEVA